VLVSLAVRLAPYFDPAVRSRGQDYAAGRRVEVVRGDSDRVEAQVRGTSRYRVTLALSRNQLRGACNCPYAETDLCKHLYAVLLIASREGHLGSATRVGAALSVVLESEDDSQPDAVDTSKTLTKRPAVNGMKPAWPLDAKPSDWAPPRHLGEHGKKSHSTSGISAPSGWESILLEARTAGRRAASERERWLNRELAYVVEISDHGDPEKIAIHALERLAGTGQWKTLSLPDGEIALLPQEDDRTILRLLTVLAANASWRGIGGAYVRAVPAKVELLVSEASHLLEAVFRTGRAYFNTLHAPVVAVLSRLDCGGAAASTPARFDEGGLWQARIDVDRGSSGSIELRGSITRGDERIDAVTANLLAPGIALYRGRAIRYADEGAFAWLSRLRQHGVIEVPAGGLGAALGIIFSSSAPLLVELSEELGFRRDDPAPPTPYASFRSPRQAGSDGGLQIDAGTEYGGIRVRFGSAGPWAIDVPGRRLFERDAAAEEGAREILLGLGARSLSPAFGQPGGFRLQVGRFTEAVRVLVTAGWRVEADGKPQRAATEFRIDVTSGIDWFDVTLQAHFGAASARMAELLAALRQGGTTVVLDDGSIGILPEEWLRQWELLAAAGEIDREKLRFRRGQAVLLDALLSERSGVNCDAAFEAMRRELATLESISSEDAPATFTGQLRDYQRDGLGWMLFLERLGLGGCLADDMGLGKTVQVLALLLARKEREAPARVPAARQPRHSAIERGKRNPSLVVVPRSLLFNWAEEAKRFAPDLALYQHHGLLRDTPSQKAFAPYDLVLTTYGTLRRDASELADIEFDYVILDEATAIKNERSGLAKAAKILRAEHRIALTGTPIENHAGELWSLFEFLNPGMLGSASVFKRLTGADQSLDDGSRKMLRRVLRPFILRRTKAEVAKELPGRVEHTLYSDFEPAERAFYDELRGHVQSSLKARVEREGIARSTVHILEGLLRLRQAACHPGLVDKKRARESSSKLDLLLEQLERLRDEGEKALVFSQFTSLLALAKKRLDEAKIRYEYLDGSTRDRKSAIQRFESDPGCPVFLISLKAGGVGLNLTAANYVFLLDPWWNPAVEAQAIDRAHRIGQTRTVFAYRLLAKGTVEEKVAELQERKRALADAILGETAGGLRALTREDLELLLT
jgi:superfamily II DNA or RNA helicase